MDFRVDYHIHSNYSDGTKSVVEIIKKYKEEGYDEIALSDHDGVDGVKEAIQLGKDYKIQVISGVEFATIHDGIEMHLLGYKFDPDNAELLNLCEDMRKRRHERNVRMLDKFKELGYELDIDELEAQSKGQYVGKPNIARMLVEKGYANEYSEVFSSEKFMEHPEIKKIKKEKYDTFDVIQVILNAGGLPVLAHPIKIKGIGEADTEEYWTNFEKILKELKKAGLKGLEVWYAVNTDSQVQKFGSLASKYHLHMTTGSDYHGEDVKVNYISL